MSSFRVWNLYAIVYSLIEKGGILLLMGVRLEHHWRGKKLLHILHK